MLCCVFWLFSPKCLGGKCLSGKCLHCVNASAPASTWMVRYAISSTPFWWHVRCDCSVLLFVIMWHWHPLWFGSLLDSPAPFVMMQAPWFARWSGFAVLNFCVVGFIFAWASHSSFSFLCLSLCGRLVHCFLVRVPLRVVVSFVVFVFVFIFARSQSQIDEWVSWLPKPILVLLEGGAAWGWRFSGVALLEVGAVLIKF